MDAQATPPPWPARPAVVKTDEPEPEEPETKPSPAKSEKSAKSTKSEKSVKPESGKPVQPVPPWPTRPEVVKTDEPELDELDELEESEPPEQPARPEKPARHEKPARAENVVKSVKQMQPPPPPPTVSPAVRAVRSDPEVVAVAVFQPRAVSLPRDFIVRCVAVIAVATVLGGIFGFGVAKMGTPVYGARSEILFQLGDANPTGFLREDRRLSTQLVALKSREVLLPVAQANDMTVDELAKKVSGSVLEESEIIRIQVTDPSKETASKLTKEVVANFLRAATPRANADVQRYLKDQIAQIDAALVLLRETSDSLASQNPGGPSTQAQLRNQAEIQAKIDQRSALSDRLNDATVQELTQPRIEQLTDVYTLDAPVAPKPVKSGIAGALAGFMIGLLAAAFMVWRRLARDRPAG